MYLSEIQIKNYRGIKELVVEFDSKINVFIGENGSCKSALIDAIRLLYNFGQQQRDIFVTNDDFYVDSKTQEQTKIIEITFKFYGLSDNQKGALNEYMVFANNGGGEDYAQIGLIYERRENRGPSFNYFTGAHQGQKADFKTFDLFQHYYLGALRDSARDLLRTRGNVLGGVIKRKIDKNNSEVNFTDVISTANNDLLNQTEVVETRDSINSNLSEILQRYSENQIGLQIEQAQLENIVNIIKPFLPFNIADHKKGGFSLWQNSLGFNNLIYIATVLGDISQRVDDDELSHYALLIEEPEAHLHPQLQLSLHNFLSATNTSENSQLFITTHSPTLTSKLPLTNLILLDDMAYKVSNCFHDRDSENLIQDTNTGTKLTQADIETKRKQLERYIDVTKSQLFYAKGVLLVEGISEELLIPSFCQIQGYKIEDFRLELVNVDGTSFYPFLYLFNSTDPKKRIPKPIALITDDDRYSDSKKPEYSFDKLVENDYAKLDELFNRLKCGALSRRVKNLESIKNNQDKIVIKSAFQTLELEIAINNVPKKKADLWQNLFVVYLNSKQPDKLSKITDFCKTLPDDDLTDDLRLKLAILLWKAMPDKVDFAQDFSLYLLEKLDTAKTDFYVPKYILDALDHLTKI